MGIPQLLQNLEKIKKPQTRLFPDGPKDDQSCRPKAIIDGSALAHHVFNKYVKTFSKEDRIQSVLGFDYAAYQRAVFSWLKQLEAGFDILGIYVDGHLPGYKTETRISRIQTSVNYLSRLRNLSPSIIDLLKVSNWNPTPSFLILAFSSVVQSHERYGSLLHTAPGEADAFCASAAYTYTPVGFDAKNDIAVIFTSDSDLLVYPSQPHARVALLNDVAFEYTPEGRKVKVVLWSPTLIAQSFPGGNGTILQFVWCLIHNPMAIARLLSGSKDSLKNVQVGNELASQYTLPLLGEATEGAPKVILDSRAAEIIYCAAPYSQHAFPEERKGDVAVYLPVLVEDVTKASVWNIGLSFRKTAYQLLVGKDATLFEVHRKAASVNRSSISLKTEETISVKELSESGSLRPWNIHPLVQSIILEIIEDRVNRNSPLSDYDVMALVSAVTAPILTAVPPTIYANYWTWPRNQLFSQLQAGLYSIYLLQTIISLKHTVIPEDLQSLTDAVGTFPHILKTFSPARFMHVYAIAPDPSLSKKAKNRQRRRLKASSGGSSDITVDAVTRVMQLVFKEEDREYVAHILKSADEKRREKAKEMEIDDDDDDGNGAEEKYMGMTVG